MNKQCNGCNKLLSLENFNWKDKNNNKKQSQCKKCTRKKCVNHYKNNKVYYFNKNNKHRKLKKEYIAKLKNVKCIDCKRKYPPECMDFDHLRDKIDNVSRMINSGYKKIKNEIKKCEIVCANCHRIRTKNRL